MSTQRAHPHFSGCVECAVLATKPPPPTALGAVGIRPSSVLLFRRSVLMKMLMVQPHVLLHDGIQVDFMVVLEQNHSVDAKDFSHVCDSGRIGNSRISGYLSFCVKRGLGKLSKVDLLGDTKQGNQ